MRPLRIGAARLVILALGGAVSLFGQLSIMGGNGQSANVSTNFSQQLQVQVGSACGSNCSVTFTVASLQNAAFCNPGCATSITVPASSGGVTLRAGTLAGAYQVSATDGTSTVYFQETNTAGPPANITAMGGTPQSAAFRSFFSSPLQALVTDAYGNPIAAWVDFYSPSTPATVSWTAGWCPVISSIFCETNSGTDGTVTVSDVIAGATAGTAIVTAYATTDHANWAGPATFSLTNVPGPLVTMTIDTSPSGLEVHLIDGLYTYQGGSFQWPPGTSHEIITTSPQAGAAGTQYVFANWSDGGAAEHSVTLPSSDITYTANFTTQYQMTTVAGPGGSVSPGLFWDAGSTFLIYAIPNPGYTFAGWLGTGTGSCSSSANPCTVTINSPIQETATFVPASNVSVTVDTAPTGLFVIVDGSTYTAPKTFTWVSNTTHSIATSSPQAGAAGTQYVFANWSDGGGLTHTVTVPLASTSYVASFSTQYLLTMTAGMGGGVSPPGGYYNATAGVSISATPSSGYVFAGWTGAGLGSCSGAANPCTVTMNGPIQEAGAFNQPGNVNVTVDTSPTGLSILVDKAAYTAPAIFSWAPGGTHTIATSSPQAGTSGTTQYGFANWSDGGGQTHTVTVPSTATSYVAGFTMQYRLTLCTGWVICEPPNPLGSLSPPNGYYNAGSTVSILATPNPGLKFIGWAGSMFGAYTGTANPATVTMNGPIGENATFAPATTVSITVDTSPAGLPITVDSTAYTAPANLNWTPGSTHTIAISSPQAGASGTQYVFSGWSDSGDLSHTVTAPNTATTYVAYFTTQYLLTMTAGAGGSVSPPSGYYYIVSLKHIHLISPRLPALRMPSSDERPASH